LGQGGEGVWVEGVGEGVREREAGGGRQGGSWRKGPRSQVGDGEAGGGRVGSQVEGDVSVCKGGTRVE